MEINEDLTRTAPPNSIPFSAIAIRGRMCSKKKIPFSMGFFRLSSPGPPAFPFPSQNFRFFFQPRFSTTARPPSWERSVFWGLCRATPFGLLGFLPGFCFCPKLRRRPHGPPEGRWARAPQSPGKPCEGHGRKQQRTGLLFSRRFPPVESVTPIFRKALALRAPNEVLGPAGETYVPGWRGVPIRGVSNSERRILAIYGGAVRPPFPLVVSAGSSRRRTRSAPPVRGRSPPNGAVPPPPLSLFPDENFALTPINVENFLLPAEACFCLDRMKKFGPWGGWEGAPVAAEDWAE